MNEMKISQFPQYLFWQYKPEADLPDLVVLENLLLYGDFEDLLKIPQLFSIPQIKVVYESIEASRRWKKRAFFIKKILLAE
jgi:hypothetical protein